MEGDSGEISLADIFSIVRRSWILILGCALAAGAAAAGLAFALTPVYRAEVLLAPAAEGAQSGSALSRLAEQFAPLSAVVGDIGGSGGLAAKEVRVATLQSRHLTEAFIQEKNLLPVLFPERWDSATHNWKLKNGRPVPPTLEDGFRRFDQKVRTVNEDRRTGLVTLVIEWRDPQLVAAWANELVTRTNEYMRKRAIAEAQRSTAYLESELGKTGVVERQQIIYRLIESKTSEIMMANARPEYAFEIVDPAVAPGRNHFVSPKRPMIVLIGLIIGLCLGIGYAIVRWAQRSSISEVGHG
jgi:uncharacterized protein involved in exopolysaccharide biosynthesis